MRLVYVDIIKLINQGCTTDARLLVNVCHVKINRGLRQSDTISPKLSAVTLEVVFRKMNYHGRIMIDGEMLTHLLFTDDCALIATNPHHLQQDLQQLANLSKQIGLKVNLPKTKWMKNSFCAEGVTQVNDAENEEMTFYICLGRQPDPNDILDGEFMRRRKARWIAFNKNRVVLPDQRLPMNVRANIFRTIVLPAKLYVCEKWGTMKRDEEKFAVAERATKRRICSVTRIYPLSNEELRLRTRVQDVVSEIHVAKSGGQATSHGDMTTA
ncbi:unnamed protein product [Toxocara canis]|uniref:Reverse transcriptase domain-containing protein n=1 Tax=Toxocara canis TaxID=6265 RepID=A0A183UJU0_TOXCA|nr:unnamed protein product [Toxocara canis]